MNRGTAFFLVLLRLAIGWHFLFEGIQKVESIRTGPSEISKPFSSAVYFREAPGPLGPVMRKISGDPNAEARAKLVVAPLPAGHEPKNVALHTRTPAGLAEEWDDYLKRFSDHYKLDEDQRKKAGLTVQQAKDNVVLWLTMTEEPSDPKEKEKFAHFKKKVTKAFGNSSVEVEQYASQRISEYLAKLAELEDVINSRLYALGKDVEKTKLNALKADVTKQRNELLKDLDEQTAEMKKHLDELLTAEQKKTDALPPVENVWQKYTDLGTAWMMTIAGGCLLIGLFTRLSSVILAGFLLSTYLLWPAFPWAPSAPNTEGNYYYINKNAVEFLALLVLASSHVGRWVGLDAWLHPIVSALFGRKKPQPTKSR